MLTDYIVLDLEMTGLHAKTDHILEFGAVKVRDNQIVDTFASLVRQTRALPEVVQQLTGITDTLILEEDAPEEEVAFADFCRFCESLPIVGHNLMADYRFLKQCAVNHKEIFEKAGIDTLQLARTYLPEPKSKSLDSLCEYFQIERAQRHRALDDAIATQQLFAILQAQYGSTYGEKFSPKMLQYKAKKQTLATPAQKRDLIHLQTYHKIDLNLSFEELTRSEASRLIDRIYLNYGRDCEG